MRGTALPSFFFSPFGFGYGVGGYGMGGGGGILSLLFWGAFAVLLIRAAQSMMGGGGRELEGAASPRAARPRFFWFV